ncbi:DUF2157 domain-containing protein [Pseudofulvibacter geojedonensis]|uniref:DUF2157 domain-containing protein n=1 Tax=Pseudofulvibacter geojedonensis TaxID=1123758 RepID=A0ABW3I5K1_9FLAO
MKSKILNELPQLVKDEVITQEISDRIKQYYSSKEVSSPNKLLTVFGVLGSILVGLGIILIIAHNWDFLPKYIKTLLAFIPLLIGQVMCGYSILKKKSASWRESSGVFLFFAVGSGMALISQIYNIPGNFSTYLLTWIALCLPLIYLLRSNALYLLTIIFSTYYACQFGLGNNKTPWMYLLLIISVIPFYLVKYKKEGLVNVLAVSNWLLPLSLISVLGSFVVKEWELLLVMYILLFSSLYIIGMLPLFKNHSLRKNGFAVLGSIGMIVVLLISSFKWIWEELNASINYSSQEFMIVVVLLLINIGLLVMNKLKSQKESFNLFLYIGCLFVLLFFIGLQFNVVGTILVNVLLFLLGVMAIKRGVDKTHFAIMNYGLLIISTLIICRFFDTNISFVIRGILFVLIGVGFFVANYTMMKLNAKKK